jgi:hypothetical protein
MALPTARWRPLIDVAVAGLVLPANVFEAMVLVESNGDPNARSASDARGLAQLIPRWHKDGIGKKVALLMGRPLTDALWFDPEFSLRCGARHLTWCYVSDGSRSWERAVRAYFTGTPDPPAGFANAQGTSVEQHIRKFRDALVRVDDDRGASPAGHPPAGGASPMVDHVYVFSMGHRNAGPDVNGNPARGGAPGEPDWTPKCTRMVAEEFRERGAKVFIAQEEDGDNDPDDSWPMKREAVARLSARVAKEQGAIAYLSFHYNGSGGTMPGFHAVVPDAVGSGVGNLISNNPKDVRLAQAIAERLRASNTVKIHKDGVYSEFDTGAVAGEPGARLGELKGTLSIREQAVRLILEAADFSTARERAFLQDDDWVRNVYAVAVADGCADVFGAFPNPDGRPAGGFADPSPIAELTEFVANGALVKTPPPVVTIASGEEMHFVNATARAIRDTPRRKFGSRSAPSVGPDIQAGQTFTVAWRYRAGNGNTWFLTPFWTRVDANDVELVG